MDLIDLIVENCEISCMGIAGHCLYTDAEYRGEYRGWKIYLSSPPNGGILGFEIIHYSKDLWLGSLTFLDFDYCDSDGIVAYAKENIDKVETYLASISGQLQLF
jgi:hypothetical protein